MDNSKNEMGEMVLLARKRFRYEGKRCTQSRFASLIGCSTTHLNAIECGKHMPSIGLLERMAAVMEMKLRIEFTEKPK